MGLLMRLLSLAAVAGATTLRERMEADVTQFSGRNWIRGARVSAEETVELEFWLKHDAKDVAAFHDTLVELATPGSPKYAQWLSAEEVAEKLSPSREAMAAVLEFVTFDLNAKDVHVNKLKSVVEVTVPAAAVEAALETELYHWSHAQYSKVDVVRCANGYALPSAVARHVSVVGELIRFPRMRFAGLETEVKFEPPSSVEQQERRLRGGSDEQQKTAAAEWEGCGPLYSSYVNPYVLQTRYGFEFPYTGGQATNSLALAEFQTQYYDNTDLEAFSDACGIEDPITIDVTVGGNTPGACALGLEPCIESLLDIEYAGAIAGDIPLQVYYSTSYALLDFANKLQDAAEPPKVVSVSYGNDEAQQTGSAFMESVNTAFMKIGAQGVSILFAAGDQGVWGREGVSTHFHPDFPAGSPYVTAVGGTDFATRGQIGEETTWADGGSGFSDEFDEPEWQAPQVANYLANGGAGVDKTKFTPTGRAYPDISALAGQVNPYFISYKDGRFSAVAGTSAACPVVAAIFAQINDKLIAQGKSSLGWLNPFLYTSAKDFGGAYNDVTTGNTNGGRGTGFPAAVGWDAATGFGTPAYDGLLGAALAAQK
mmetsp:Transcript_11786/g.35362  ORF Transcript_11786/g.35362 Transcript_11786/m.35362 type:complete len:597 (-) Transcript_11786:1216-3006(-)|eukprot:CAMPEP_0198655306 /NCGR_PEP_ID=MMETSP1467-20131203/8268_1 /TAXON_ID=1462469 /ORGANISM="unid. sp., Strain CCMP2135" /LENGTH=596 /DNA_ID=CAMNT_0044391311 /DNA_START=77 /DNA_END=1867 /DNA_ORIENTATION=+